MMKYSKITAHAEPNLIRINLLRLVMKPIYFILAVLASVTILAISTQQIYAPRDCAGCAAFKKLTTQFEKDVIDAASINPPDGDKIQELLGEYSDNVVELFRTPSTSP